MRTKRWGALAVSAMVSVFFFSIADAGIQNGRFELPGNGGNRIPFWAEFGGPYPAPPNSDIGEEGTKCAWLPATYPSEAEDICFYGIRGVVIAQKFYCDGEQGSTCYVRFDYGLEEEGGGTAAGLAFIVIDGPVGRKWARLNGTAPFIRRQVGYPSCDSLIVYFFVMSNPMGKPILYVDNVFSGCDESWPGVSSLTLLDYSEFDENMLPCADYALGQVDFFEVYHEFEGVPALQSWSIAALVLLLIAGGVYVIYRRRRAMA